MENKDTRSKGFHESFAQFFEKPTRDSLAQLLQEHGGETNNLDFKATFPACSKLARHILAMANSSGGAIVFGVDEKGDNTLDAVGLLTLVDKAAIKDKIKRYLPNRLLNNLIEVIDFPYDSPAYPTLAGKKFQVLLIGDDPTAVPFVSKADGDDIRESAIYVRHLTSSELANYEDIQSLISRRISTGVTSQINLREHIDQLRALYDVIPQTLYTSKSQEMIQAIFEGLAGTPFPNPNYPKELFESFISRMIEEKKRRIVEVLNLPEV
jgi:Putative DNA-binding domain